MPTTQTATPMAVELMIIYLISVEQKKSVYNLYSFSCKNLGRIGLSMICGKQGVQQPPCPHPTPLLRHLCIAEGQKVVTNQSAIRLLGNFVAYSLTPMTQFPTGVQRYTYGVLQTIQMKLIFLCVWAERVVLGSAKTAFNFKQEI